MYVTAPVPDPPLVVRVNAEPKVPAIDVTVRALWDALLIVSRAVIVSPELKSVVFCGVKVAVIVDVPGTNTEIVDPLTVAMFVSLEEYEKLPIVDAVGAVIVKFPSP